MTEAAATTPTAADQLSKLEKQLGDIQSQTTDLGKQSDRLKVEIADLKKAVADIDTKSKAWSKSADTVGQQQKDFATYVKTKKQMLEATVPDKAAVVKAKQDAQQKLTDSAKQVDDLSKKAADKEKAWDEAKAAVAAKQAAYTAIANMASSNDAALKDLAALKAAADKEGAANHVSKMYFLVLLMEDVLKNVTLTSAADYQKKLDAAAADLSAANTAERDAKEAF